MSKFVTLVLEPRFNDEYGEYANLPVFNAHGDVVGYTGGEVSETGNPCKFCVMDEEGFPTCHSASENAQFRQQLADVTESMGRVEERCAKLHKENVKLLRKIRDLENDEWVEGFRDGCEAVSIVTKEGHKVYTDEIAELRELAKKLKACNSSCGRCIELYGICEHETELRALGIEVDG